MKKTDSATDIKNALPLGIDHEQARRARAELLEDMEKYSEVFGCYLILDKEGLIQYLNLQGIDILGVENLRQQSWRLGSFVLESDRDTFDRFLMRTFNNGMKEQCEVLLQAADRRVWVRLEGKVSQDGKCCHAVLFDISERKRAEANLSASEVKYRALFANMNTAFSYHKFIRDKKGIGTDPILMGANDAYGMMLGMPVSEIIGKNFSEINSKGCAPSLDWERLCHDVVVQSQPACFDYYDKSLKRWLSVIAYSPAPEHMALVYVDITKTKIAEQAVSESEQRYRSVVQGTNVVIMIINERAEITFINEYGLSFFGFSAEELISRPIFETIAPICDATGSPLQETFNKFKARTGQQRRYIQESLTSTGRRVWVDWTNHSMQDPKTGEQMYICVGVDVTESKRAEQAAQRRLKQQRQKEFFNDSIKRGLSVSEWLTAAQLMGIDLQPPLVMSLIEIPSNLLTSNASEQDQLERQYAIDSLIETLQYVGAGVTWQAPDGIAVLRPVTGKGVDCSAERSRTIAMDIVKIVSRYWNGIPLKMGISRFTNQIQNVSEMYMQARSALTYGPILHPDRLVHYWYDLGCYQFVLNDLGSDQARRFVRDTLGTLLNDTSGEEPGELLLTLRELLTGESAQVVAKKLHVHPQTVAFRKKKIEKNLNIDLNCMETRLKLTIATRLLSFMDKNVRMAHLVG